MTIEFFVDSRSSASRWLYKVLLQMSQRHPARLRVLFRFPFSDVFSNAARISFRRGVFVPFTERIYGSGFPNRRDLESIATDLDMDWPSFEAELEAPYHREQAARDLAFARRRGLRRLSASRPSLLINGNPFEERRRSIDTLEEAYDTALAQARRLLDHGYRLDELYEVMLSESAGIGQSSAIRIGSLDGPPLGEEARAIHGGLAGPIAYDRAIRIGPDDAPVSLTWFCSPRSSLCSRLFSEIRNIHSSYPTDVRSDFFPLYDTGDKDGVASRQLHLALLCAHRDGDVAALLSHFYTRLGRSELSQGALEESLDNNGFSSKKILRCMKSRKTKDAADKALDVAKRARIPRAPAVVVEGTVALGVRSFNELASMVENALGRSTFVPLPGSGH